MKTLLGKTITTVSVNDDQSILVFGTNDGPVAFYAEGDCCSESWFADITGFDALLGGTVAEIEEVSMEGYNVEDGRSRQDCDEVYGYKIKTDKGHSTIAFRNSSNGCYGGWLGDHTGPLPENLTSITDDWSA
jgi:hypothetical protein